MLAQQRLGLRQRFARLVLADQAVDVQEPRLRLAIARAAVRDAALLAGIGFRLGAAAAVEARREPDARRDGLSEDLRGLPSAGQYPAVSADSDDRASALQPEKFPYQ